MLSSYRRRKYSVNLYCGGILVDMRSLLSLVRWFFSCRFLKIKVIIEAKGHGTGLPGNGDFLHKYKSVVYSVVAN